MRPEDGASLRQVRLRALIDSPSAFASSLAQESDRPIKAWEDRARIRAAGVSDVGFFAVEDERLVGMVAGYFDAEGGEADVVHLIAMWVDPAARACGAGRALTQAVLAWAREREARLVKLWVATNNAPAVRLYERCGFRHTRILKPLPSDPARLIERMERVP